MLQSQYQCIICDSINAYGGSCSHTNTSLLDGFKLNKRSIANVFTVSVLDDVVISLKQ